ncbi:ATP-binding cassette domain-containing protein [Scatolibacter rhodanostii]|uniref:ATP-binding cassette domain-containing protein n=1 Tax=Scatolibacter rhodanostii TaxID=2014781 RepID=UPI000C088092|nr:ABC transporter ATP-binding protein [Scatolibacter rhodanostii]
MKYSRFVGVMVLLTCFNAATSLVAPVLLSVWSRNDQSIDLVKAGILLGILLGTIAINIVIVYFREQFAVEFNVSHGKELFGYFVDVDYDTINEAGPTSMIEKILMAVNNSYRYYTSDAIEIWSNLLILFALLLMTFLTNILIACMLLILVPINYFGYKWLNKELLQRSKDMQEKTSEGAQSLISIAGQTDYLKQSSDHTNVLEQIATPLKKMYQAMSKVNKFGQISHQLFSNINDICRVFIMVLVVYEFTSQTTNVVDLIFFTVVLPIYFSGLTKIVSANLSKRDLIASKEFVQWMRDNKEENGERELAQVDSIRLDIKTLQVNNVILGRDIEAAFTKGDIVWVKGESGSGKSTLLKLLPKFRTADTVYINEIDLREYTNASLRKQVEYLSQNVPIIHGTLLENLFFNKAYSKEAEITMQQDPLLQTILAEKSLDAEIFENGSNLSGGEKQKIAFIRALYNEADILILDEITSNIDVKSAVEIYDRMKEVAAEKIIFAITHSDALDGIANKVIDLDVRNRYTC